MTFDSFEAPRNSEEHNHEIYSWLLLFNLFEIMMVQNAGFILISSNYNLFTLRE